MGLPVGAGQPCCRLHESCHAALGLGVGRACRFKALPGGAGGLCILGLHRKSRDLAILTDVKEINCLTL